MDTIFLVGVLAAAAGLMIGWLGERTRLRRARADAGHEAERIRSTAREEADRARKAAELEGREAAVRIREEWEREEGRRREEIERAEARLDDRRANLDRKYDVLEQKESLLDDREEALNERLRAIDAAELEVGRREAQARSRLEEMAGMSASEAKKELIHRLEDEARAEAANTLRQMREDAKREADREAKNIVGLAIQRIAADHTAESVVSVVSLPSDEMKGRIIGREGRNIRAFEQVTGIDVIIDDTPEAVILSGFDPIRREVARIALEKLVADGRIHPGRIEELVEKSQVEVEESMFRAAEEILYELGVHGVATEVIRTLGRLKFRTSYGQNQLVHSREVALLAGNMALELGVDPIMCRRMGILHDVGKGLTHEQEGTHVELGYALCKRHGEPDQVLNAIKAHHDEEPHRYPETFLVTAADAISGARPGARREMFETYVKRLEKLEAIAQGFEGVERCFAIQAGREIRVMVDPEKAGDAEMAQLSEQIARTLEDELQYPGQIKVVVIRETRAVDFAR
jgi:ribonucrease Y